MIFAPREQQDANEYSQMLGTYTAKALSTGMSQPRGWGQARQASTSSNISDHARPLMLPQELKELGPTRQIVSLSHTKPILCDKAFFYLDPIFVDRLKAVSPTLASLGRKLPMHSEFEAAAFVQKDLSVEIPLLDLDLHKAKVERRMRPLTVNEAIDPATLAIDPGRLPPIVQRDVPTVAEVTQLVDAFLGQVAWAEPGHLTGSGKETAAKGRPPLTREEEEDPLGTSSSPRSAVDRTIERER